MERNESQNCKNALDDGKAWVCFCNEEGKVKSFVSKAYGGLDFDENSELHQIKTTLGQMFSIRKIR